MSTKVQGKWIQNPLFADLVPRNVFDKELAAKEQEVPPHPESLLNNHMLVRRHFFVSDSWERALLKITADDYYKLYINDEYVGQGPAPSYYFHYYYNQYDITEYLQPGKNVIAVHVYYQGLVNRVWNSGDLRQGMWCELFIDDQYILGTDETWLYKNCQAFQYEHVIGYETQFQENIDARLWDADWRNIDYNDLEWYPAFVNTADDYKLYPQSTPSVEVHRQKPQSITKIGNGHFLIDFGQEITGSFTMQGQSQCGQVVEIRCGEELDNNERVRYDMRCNCLYQEYWTLSGNVDVLEHYDYKAFRYVEVIAPANTVNPKTFAASVRHYPLDENACNFSTMNQALNHIWQICKNGVKYGSQEAYLDCPSREKGQYLGDLAITGHAHLYLSGDLRLYKKAILDFAHSSYVCPGLMAVAPGSFMQEIADYSLQWPMLLLRYYKHSGDKQFLEEMYPVANNLLKYFDRYRRNDGLLEEVTDKWNLVDWPRNLRDNYDFPLTKPIGSGCHNVINAFYYGMVQAVNEIKSILGISYDDDLPSIKKAFIDAFYHNELKCFVDAPGSAHAALHSIVVPMYFGLTPDEAIDPSVALVKAKGLSCGVYMAYFVLKALAKVEKYQLITDLITNQGEQSWVNMLREDATCCFEAWGKEQKWNTSLCHPWASAPIPVIIEDILGLTPHKPGWQEISFNPHITSDFNNLKFHMNIRVGTIGLTIKDGKLDLQVPPGIKVVGKSN